MAVNGVGESTYCHELSVDAIQPRETACQAPYITATGAGSPGPVVSTDPTQGELTIQRTSVGEPFINCTDKSITFVMKVKTLSPAPPPNGIWQILFDVPASATTDGSPHTLFVEATTSNNPASMAFSYGWRGTSPTGGSLDQGGPTAGKVTGTANADGTITMKLDVSTALIFNNVPAGTHAFDATISPGTLLNHLQGITYVLVGAEPGGIGGGSIQVVSQTGNLNSYTTTGNLGCSAGEPVAGLTATPMSAAAPANVTFDASSSNDTSPCATIVSYTLNFGDGTAAVTQTTPMFSHTYNSAGDYAARLVVTDSTGRASNAAQVVISVDSNAIQLAGVVSRKIHGTAPIDLTLSLNSPATIEPRAAGHTGTNGVDYQLIFVFPSTLSSVGSPTAPGASNTAGFINPNDAHQYIVNLTGVPNQQYTTVTLNNVHDADNNVGNVSATIGVLVGDVNGDKRVDGNDVSAVQSATRQNATSTNFRLDPDASGRIDGNDVSLVQSQTRTGLP
jgi:PKD repeat protein